MEQYKCRSLSVHRPGDTALFKPAAIAGLAPFATVVLAQSPNRNPQDQAEQIALLADFEG